MSVLRTQKHSQVVVSKGIARIELNGFHVEAPLVPKATLQLHYLRELHWIHTKGR